MNYGMTSQLKLSSCFYVPPGGGGILSNAQRKSTRNYVFSDTLFTWNFCQLALHLKDIKIFSIK